MPRHRRRRYTDEEKGIIYDSTSGYCHLCWKKISFTNYGRVQAIGGWEVDHSNARGRGGTDRINNLKPACISCNRSKQVRTNRSVRAENGVSRAPLSRKARAAKRRNNTVAGGLGGAGVGLAVAGPPGAVVGGLLGLLAGNSVKVK